MLAGNADWYRKIWFRPRVMAGVKDVTTSRVIMGHKFNISVFSSPAALAKLSHPDGELVMARGLVAKGTTIVACSGLARASGAFIDSDLKWDDIPWLNKITDVPLYLKGIQCAADARKALEYGCAGIYISNHGVAPLTQRSRLY
jgi:isopentenyl diphosphate isomerase/L-lactate dehydrogenase-like FMN-dependent dehydrogenase